MLYQSVELEKHLGIAALVAAISLVFSGSALAGFDLSLYCTPDRVDASKAVVPQNVQLDIDREKGRVRLKDDVLAETNSGWLFVDDATLQSHQIRFGCAINPTKRQVLRNRSLRGHKFRVVFSYRIDLKTLVFKTRVRAGVAYNHNFEFGGKCQRRG